MGNLGDHGFPPHVKPCRGGSYVQITGRAECGHLSSCTTGADDWEEHELDLLLYIRSFPCPFCLGESSVLRKGYVR